MPPDAAPSFDGPEESDASAPDAFVESDGSEPDAEELLDAGSPDDAAPVDSALADAAEVLDAEPSDASEPSDAAPDIDAGMDAGADDAGVDASPADAGVDASPADAGTDAGSCPAPTGAPRWGSATGSLSALPGSTRAFSPFPALTSADQLVIAWSEGTDNYVARSAGTFWTNYGGAVPLAAGSISPTLGGLALDHSDQPVVVRSANASGDVSVYVSRWNAGAWEPLGGPFDATPGSTPVSGMTIAIDALDRPVVAWHEFVSGAYTVFVVRWNGAAWDPLGGPLSAVPGTNGGSARLAVSASGQLVVAWDEADGIGGQDVYVREWSGSAWTPVGGPIRTPGATYSGAAAIAYDALDRLVVARVEDDSIRVVRWSGTAWENLGAAVDSVGGTTVGFPLTVAIDMTSNQPIVAFRRDGGALTGTYVYRWTGTAWGALGLPLPGRGRVVADACGRPIVAVGQDPSGGADVLVERYEP